MRRSFPLGTLVAILIALIAYAAIPCPAAAQRVCDNVSTSSGEPTDPECAFRMGHASARDHDRSSAPPATQPPVLAPVAADAASSASSSPSAWVDSLLEALRRIWHAFSKGSSS
jgi:hypothetical protein